MLLLVTFFEQQGDQVVNCNHLVCPEEDRFQLTHSENEGSGMFQAKKIRVQQPQQVTLEFVVG
jgi:hypothetical protein